MNGEKSKCLKKIKVLPQSIQIEIPTAWQKSSSTTSIELIKNANNIIDDEKKKIILINNNVSAIVASETKHFLVQYSNSNHNEKKIGQSTEKWKKICFKISCSVSCKSIRVQAKKIQQVFPLSSSLVPWVLVTNSLIQIFVHILSNGKMFNKFAYSPLKRKEIWRFFTYNFLHTGTVHLILNIFIQILVAIPLEIEQGHLKVLIIYFGGVISGAIGASVFQPTLLMVGASAGVYSLLISHIPHVLLNFDEISYRFFRIASVAVLCASDIIFVINHCLTHDNTEPRISVAAHGSGAIAGLLLGLMIYDGITIQDTYERVLRYSATFFYCLFVIIAIVYIVFY